MKTETELYALAHRVGALLLARGGSLAAAESCTGGWVCQAVTGVPGSSDWFDRGFVTYSNAAKREMLDVPEQVLLSHGAVSEATVLAMAEGALRHSRAECALAVSGIAGPDGGSADKPLGTVCFAWARRDGAGFCETRRFRGGRREVRLQSVAWALEGVLRLYGAS